MYKQEYKKSVLIMSSLILLVGAFFYWINKPVTLTIYADKAPVTSTVAPLATPQPTITIPTDIVGYINYKFGSDAPKAFELLQGISPTSCAENRTLSPNEINYNWTKTPGVYSSIDRGYWQFNNKFHPEVSDACAKDVKCSTDRAYEIFKHDGSFKQWSAGRCLGI